MYAHDNKWLMVVNSGQPIKTRLICFPYAEADPEQFRTWASGLDDHIELITLRLPGHGSRLDELAYDQWALLLDDMFSALKPYLRKPHAFFGHSLGARLAYEMAKRAQARYPGQTRHLFISGCRSPDAQQHESFKLAERWSNHLDIGLDTPLTALYGSDDLVDTATSMMNWRAFTRGAFELIEISGDHLFVNAQRRRLLHIINTHLGLLSE
ncbi:MAG: thioesterase [Pseudomonas sp.]|nr:thioesterase [Pseudomonas sp.]